MTSPCFLDDFINNYGSKNKIVSRVIEPIVEDSTQHVILTFFALQ